MVHYDILFALVAISALALAVILFLLFAFAKSRCKHKWNTFTTVHCCDGNKCFDKIGQCCDVCGKIRYVKEKKE